MKSTGYEFWFDLIFSSSNNSPSMVIFQLICCEEIKEIEIERGKIILIAVLYCQWDRF